MSTPSSREHLSAERLEQLSKGELVGLIVQQQRLIVELQDAVERLKERLQSDSQTSSKPPSTDLLKKPEQATEEQPAAGQKRRPGGQPGHRGKTRKGFGSVDRYEVLRLEHCPVCGGSEFEAEPVQRRRHQVARLVEQPIEIVEYEQQHCQCQCGQLVAAAWPTDVVPGQDLSVGLQSLLVWLGNYGHLSYDKQQELVVELGGPKLGRGTLQATNQRMADAVIQPVDGLWQWARGQQQVHVDETAWPVKGLKEWLWVAAGAAFCLFHAAGTRARDELEAMLGAAFAGVLSSDDFSVYNGYAARAQQKCLAHLRRHFKRVQRLKQGNNEAVATAFLQLIDEAFERHRRWRDDGDGAAYHDWAADFKVRLAKTLKQWTGQVGHAAGLLLRSLNVKAQQWWYFLDHPGVPPDNNLAERSLRLAVTKRKVCGGSRSMLRFVQTADLLSVIQTCRRQGRSAIGFFKQALMAQHHSSVNIPSLLPDLGT